MSDIQAKGEQEFTIRATVIRADGTREELGTLYGGSPLQKVASYLRVKLANFKQQWRRKQS